MQKIVKKLIVKAVFFIILCVAVNIIMKVFMPVIDTQVSINQLNGGNEAFVALQSWLAIKRYVIYFLIVLGAVLFSGDIFRLIKIQKSKNDSVDTFNK